MCIVISVHVRSKLYFLISVHICTEHICTELFTGGKSANCYERVGTHENINNDNNKQKCKKELINNKRNERAGTQTK
jgi:hypothetical protein